MSIHTPHYGLHTTEDGVRYIHQGRGAYNFIGLREPSPFQVIAKKSLPCPHLINQGASIPDIEHWRQFSRLMRDPLVEAMFPIPKDRGALVAYVADPNNSLGTVLVTLSRMSSPIYPVVMPLHSKTRAQLIAELSITNICPLVLTNVACEDYEYMMELAQESRMLPRTLIFTGHSAIPVRSPLVRMVTHLWDINEMQFLALPMESLGTLILRRYARGENLYSELVKGNL